MNRALQLISTNGFNAQRAKGPEAAVASDEEFIDAYSQTVIRVAEQTSPSMVNIDINQRLQAFGRC